MRKTTPDVVAAILGHIKWRFDVLLLPARPPPLAYSEEPAGVATDSYYI
ncbi:MAG: hypothetical protein HYX75_02875 [Acidobacteria bacterium]|nr:hypothetical protein [Acidobacteriota bacterium]